MARQRPEYRVSAVRRFRSRKTIKIFPSRHFIIKCSAIGKRKFSFTGELSCSLTALILGKLATADSTSSRIQAKGWCCIFVQLALFEDWKENCGSRPSVMRYDENGVLGDVT